MVQRKVQYKQWFKTFEKEKTAGVYEWLRKLRKENLMTQLKDILKYLESVDTLVENLRTDNTLLQQEVRELKSALLIRDTDRNLEVSRRLNANKTEAFWRKKAEALNKYLIRANKVNKKMYRILHNISQQADIYKDFNIFRDTPTKPKK